MKWLRTTVGVALMAALPCLLVSCSSIDTHTIQYVGAPQFPPGDPDRVEILRAEPKRPLDRLGEIVIDASTDPAPPIAKVEARLRTKAAKLGADAVVVVYDRLQPVGAVVWGPYWSPSVSTVTGRRLVGIAIKYKP